MVKQLINVQVYICIGAYLSVHAHTVCSGGCPQCCTPAAQSTVVMQASHTHTHARAKHVK